MRIILSGGGTGGHIYPALAIARELQERAPECQLLYVGSQGGMEEELVPLQGIQFSAVSAASLPRRLSAQIIRAGWQSLRGLSSCLHLLGSFKPNVVVTTGGYVTGPVGLAAILRHVPLVIHEQNAYPGLTNRLLTPLAAVTCLTFPEAGRYLPGRARVKVTGLPVRPEILRVTRSEGARVLGIPAKAFCLLVVGGSRGAARLNQAAVLLHQIARETPGLYLLHVTGQAGFAETMEDLQQQGLGIDPNDPGRARLLPYLHEMEYALAVSDLVVGRAGAAFLAEITARGTPSILVPYPYATNNHQEKNARAMIRAGAALVIKDSDLTPARLQREVKGLLADQMRLRRMAHQAAELGRPRAGEQICQLVLNLAQRKGCCLG